MSHIDTTRPNGQWAGEMVPGSSDYARLDQNQAKIVDGDNGGSWSPTTPIVIGGAGMSFTTAATQLSGGVTTKTGGRVVLSATTGNIPTFSAPMSDTISISCVDLLVGSYAAGQSWCPDDYFLPSTAPGPMGIQVATSAGQPAGLAIPSRYLHQGASLSKVRLTFRVFAKPQATSVPALGFAPIAFCPGTATNYYFAPTVTNWTPSTPFTLGTYICGTVANLNGYFFKATTAGTSGSTEPAWTSVVGSTVPDGTVVWTNMGLSGQLPAQIDAATYHNNGLPQTLEIDMDNSTPGLLAQNAIDHSQYTYSILFGALAPASGGSSIPSVNVELHGLALTFSNIVDLRFT